MITVAINTRAGGGMTKVGAGQPINVNMTTQGLGQTTQNLTGSQKFGQVMSAITGGLAAASGAVAPYLPGGAVLSAALSGVNSTAQAQIANGASGVNAFGGSGNLGAENNFAAIGGGGSTVPLSSPGTGAAGVVNSIASGIAGASGIPGGSSIPLSPEAQMQQAQQQNMYYLQLQQQAQQQNQQFTALSNLMNVKNQTIQAMISNIR